MHNQPIKLLHTDDDKRSNNRHRQMAIYIDSAPLFELYVLHFKVSLVFCLNQKNVHGSFPNCTKTSSSMWIPLWWTAFELFESFLCSFSYVFELFESRCDVLSEWAFHHNMQWFKAHKFSNCSAASWFLRRWVYCCYLFVSIDIDCFTL